jgi:hypothetical protein
VDYTTLALVKAAIGASETSEDETLARLITAASRAVDRFCAAPDDYFQRAEVRAEVGRALVDSAGRLRFWPRKPQVWAVSALAYRGYPAQGWIGLDTGLITLRRCEVTAWVGISGREPLEVRCDYDGGLATDVTGLPADLVEAVTVLAARWYNESKAGLSDVIGVSELGTVFFSKALPQRVVRLLEPYQRSVPC